MGEAPSVREGQHTKQNDVLKTTNDVVFRKHKVLMWRKVAGSESRDIGKCQFTGDLI